MAVSKVSDLNSLFNSIYERSLFVARERNLMLPLVTQASAVGFMDRVIPIRTQITAQVKPEGIDFASPTTFGKTEKARVTPSVNMAQVILTDEQIATDPDSARDDAVMELSGAIATKLDKDIAANFSSFTVDKGPGAGQAATIAKFAAAVSVLRNNLTMNPIVTVIHPYAWHDVWVLLGQPAATYVLLGEVANEALRSFYVGNWLNIQWFTSINVPISGTDATGAIFNREALIFDSREAPTLEPERDASLKGWELNFSAAYGTAVRRDEFGVKYTSDITEPA
jgi:hypothetical protein